MFDRLKMLLSSPAPGTASSAASNYAGRRSSSEGPSIVRHSNGLDQFFSSFRDRSDLRILDFAGASQANVSFITSLGHGISSADFMRAAELAFSEDRLFENQSNPQMADEFLQENVNFPYNHFDGALLWDSLQFLNPHLLQITVDRLFDSLVPDSYLLAFFHSSEKVKEVPLYNYRIQDQKTLMLAPRGYRSQAQFFNNRAIERLFHRFTSVKFFLTRDNLREIIVKR